MAPGEEGGADGETGGAPGAAIAIFYPGNVVASRGRSNRKMSEPMAAAAAPPSDELEVEVD